MKLKLMCWVGMYIFSIYKVMLFVLNKWSYTIIIKCTHWNYLIIGIWKHQRSMESYFESSREYLYLLGIISWCFTLLSWGALALIFCINVRSGLIYSRGCLPCKKDYKVKCITPNLIKETWRMSYYNRLDLQTLGCQPVMPKSPVISPITGWRLPVSLY